MIIDLHSLKSDQKFQGRLYVISSSLTSVNQITLNHFFKDNCSIDTETICQKWFAEHSHLDRLDAPAISPDLNPIKNIWTMTAQCWEYVFPRNLKKLHAQATMND